VVIRWEEGRERLPREQKGCGCKPQVKNVRKIAEKEHLKKMRTGAG